MSVKFIALGGAREIGANAYLLDVAGSGLLLDCGLHPKMEGARAAPSFELLGPRTVDAVFISHAHLDHLGALPLVVRRFPHLQIYMTHATSMLAPLLLRSTVRVMERRRLQAAIREYPLYTLRDVDQISYLFQGMGEDSEMALPLASRNRGRISATFYDAGHILGSAGVLLRTPYGTIFYTGDTNVRHQEMICGARYPDEPVDVLIMESTHGASEDLDLLDMEAIKEDLARSICAVADRGGTILLPVFALGRMQEILAILYRLKLSDQIPDMEIYVTGLGRAISDIYDQTVDRTRRRNRHFRIRNITTHPLPDKHGDGPHINRPSLIVASAGMLNAGSPAHSVARRILPDPKNAIFFVGYLDPDSTGYRVLAAGQGEKVDIGGGEEVAAHCEIKMFHLTAHSNRQDLITMASRLQPKRVVLVHGDNGAIDWMIDTLKERLHAELTVAELGQEIDLL